MSSTTMYVIAPDGTLSEFAEYRNGHGSGPQVWGHLAFKHLPNVKDPDARDYSSDRRHWLIDKDVLPELYKLVDACAGGESEAMETYEWRTALAVADYVTIGPEHLGLYASAMEKFAEVYAEKCKGQAFSIGEQAADLRRVASEVEKHGWRGACVQQTSVTDVWESGEMTAPRAEAMMVEALLAVGIEADTITSVISALEDWEPPDVGVPYNIDIDTRHQWLTS